MHADDHRGRPAGPPQDLDHLGGLRESEPCATDVFCADQAEESRTGERGDRPPRKLALAVDAVGVRGDVGGDHGVEARGIEGELMHGC